MLTLVGLGLWDEKDLTLRGLEAAKKADKVYIELYTSRWNGVKRLNNLIGRAPIELKREDLEQNTDKIVDEAKDKNIVLLVPGDPLVATTHLTLIEAAKKAGVGTKVVHNASIISAIAETGLHIYRFGATATVPFPEKTSGKLPESVYDVIKLNKTAGLHTLLLLDIAERCMVPKEAMELLLKIEEKRRENIFTKQINIIVFARAGSDNQKIVYGRVDDLINKNLGEPAVLIVPGIMHFTEKGFLEVYRKSLKSNC